VKVTGMKKKTQTCTCVTKNRILGNFEVFYRFTVHSGVGAPESREPK
jgi:hypothetical protein